jgi:hypothetical protein
MAQCPEWLLPTLLLAAMSLFGFAYAPLGWAAVPAGMMSGISLIQAYRGACEAKHLVRARDLPRWKRVRSFGLIYLLHLLQPVARLCGRMKHGLTPWRLRQRNAFSIVTQTKQLWSETWRPAESWLGELEIKLWAQSAIVSRGGEFDDYDFRISGGIFAGTHVLMAVEDHPQGKQYLRFRSSFAPGGLLTFCAALAAFFVVAVLLIGSPVGVLLALASCVAVVWQGLRDWSIAAGQLDAAIRAMQTEQVHVTDGAMARPAREKTGVDAQLKGRSLWPKLRRGFNTVPGREGIIR